jgi:hypothetical protein
MKLRNILLFVVLLVGLSACEDPVPSDYIPRYSVEAFLLVGRPIEGIKLYRTQNIADSFALSRAFIKDADVRILAGDDTLRLQYRDTENGSEYYLPVDGTPYEVQPSTTYRLQIRAGASDLITGITVTPARISYIREVPDTLQYPRDTINLTTDARLRVSWTPVAGITEYILRIQALDTLGYGKYLTPPTEEQNRRIYRFWEENAPKYNDVTRWAFVPATDIPGSWNAFKWFGLQDVTIFAPDPNFLKWFKQVKFGGASPSYNRLLGSVEGSDAIGVFASASVVSDTVFVLKNQP